jgi:hypothetical protein
VSECPNCPPGRKIIVQQYILHPLLIRGLKFDLRFYVALTSLDPLRVYLFNNGLVRLATQPYSEALETIDVLTAHLTNFSINRDQADFRQTEDVEGDGSGNKWSHTPFWPFLESQPGFDVPAIRRKIEDAFVVIILAAIQTFREQENHRIAFELFGFDLMIDSDQNIYVLEVNVTPALGTSSGLDAAIKTPLVTDFFNLALLPRNTELMQTIDALMMASGTDQSVRDFVNAYEFERAEERLGGFRRIFPTADRLHMAGSAVSRNDRGLHAFLLK